MAYSVEVKDKARKLRGRGFSLNEISAILNISKSTASFWLMNVNLGTVAIKRLEGRKIIGQYKTAKTKQRKRKDFFDKLATEAEKRLMKIPLKKEIFELFAAILFWCEGSKGNLTRVGFTNSDPEMVRFFLKCLRKGFNLDEKKFRIVLHLHQYHEEKKQIDYWSRIIQIPKNQFSKSFQKRNGGKRIRNDYQGCISIRYYDALIAKKLWTCYKRLTLYIGA